MTDAKIGDNSETVQKERMALLLSYARRRGEVEKEIKTLREDIRSINGEAKTSGFLAKHVKMALDMLDADKESVIVEDMQMRHSLMRALNIDLGFQLELFEDRRPDEDRAYQQGWADSAAGKSLVNPYSPGQPQFDSYAKGWHANQAELRDALQRSMEAANARAAEDKVIAEAKQAKKDKSGGGNTPTPEQMAEAQGEPAKPDKAAAIEAAGKAAKPVSNAEKARKQIAAANAAREAAEAKGEDDHVVH